MRAPSRCCVALAAAFGLLASCATEPVAPPSALDYRPVPQSTLVSKRDLNFLVAQRQRGTELVTVLARQQAGAAPHPVARLVQVRQGLESHVSVERLHESGSAADRADHKIAALEQLYALVLRQQPQARYCLGTGGRPCNAARDGVSHAQLLQALAEARERAADRPPTAVPWRVVDMRGHPTGSENADVVGVRVTTRQVPLEGVAIYFDRAPHSLCVARTRADGVAICRLEDQHGDEGEHDDATPVVATFPGSVRPDGVLLPTTYVLPRKP